MTQCRWSEEDSGSEVVFLFDVAHVHEFLLHGVNAACAPGACYNDIVPKFVSQDRIQQRTLQSIMKCGADTRKNLYANVVFSCSTS